MRKKDNTINLYQKEMISSKFPLRALVGITGAILLVAFLWFGVAKRYIEINTLEGMYEEEESNLEIIKANMSEIDNVEDDYLRYSKDYLTSKERKIVSRNIVFETIDKYLIYDCDVAKIQLTDNELVTSLYGTTMQKSSMIIDEMMNEPEGVIEYAKTRNAKRENDSSNSTVDMIIVFADEESKEINFEE